MMPGEALPWGVRQYLPIFAIIYVFTLMAGAAALSGIAHALPLRLDTVGVEYVVGIGLAFYISIQSFFVLRAHPQALRILIILLLVFFGCAFLTYNMSVKPMLALMAWLPSLIALWLLNTSRFRVLWKRLCVMRRRRTRQRRLIRQLKRTHRR
ncbi:MULTISPECIES: hypothetical protein [Pseudomonas]|uniref:hypothetical protein n=1 Tax=Pseudomonas TaxID=286 RepID=UPI0015FF4B03|nr:hypothetical protein [Pseudomonas putida]